MEWDVGTGGGVRPSRASCAHPPLVRGAGVHPDQEFIGTESQKQTAALLRAMLMGGRKE